MNKFESKKKNSKDIIQPETLHMRLTTGGIAQLLTLSELSEPIRNSTILGKRDQPKI